jgi:hypothetical protein
MVRGEKEVAVDNLRRALALDSENEQARKRLQQLSSGSFSR